MAFADSPKISKDLAGSNGSAPVNVIVQFNHAPTTLYHQKVLSLGGALRRELALVNAGAYSIPASALPALAADPDVVYITPDRPLRSAGNGSPTAVLDYHNETINAPTAWSWGLNGAGIGVAVIDSGITDLPDLDSNVVSLIAFSQDFTGSGSAADQYGHGNHVAGILAGNGAKSTGWNDSYTFLGVADNVNLINLRVLDQNGLGTDSQVIAAIASAIQWKSVGNIRIINLSLGRPVYESYQLDPLCQAVEQAWNAGIVVVVAAGNGGRDNSANTEGYGTITAPGNDPYVITVGAMNTLGSANRAHDVITSYTSKGPTLLDHVIKPDLVAPGNLIISLYSPGETLSQLYSSNEIPTSLYQWNGNSSASGTYFILSGTSMAAPMVSGAAALLLQRSPYLTPDQVKARLMKTAYKSLIPYNTVTVPSTGAVYNEQADIFTVGAGLLDIQAALSDTSLAPSNTGSALSPAAAQDAAGNTVMVPGSSAVWGQSVLWGTSVVWGSTVLDGTDASGEAVLWGDSAPWGSNSVQGSSVLWGDSVLWGSSVLWGDSVLWGSTAAAGDPASTGASAAN